MFMLPFAPLEEVLRKHMAYYYVNRSAEGRWSLTPKGYLVSNSIITDLLIAQEGSQPMRRL